MASHSRTPQRLYRQHFTPAEQLLLDRFRDDDGSSEIDLLRIVLARALRLSTLPKGVGWLQDAAALSAYCRTARNLAALTRCRITVARFYPDPLLESFAVDRLEDL